MSEPIKQEASFYNDDSEVKAGGDFNHLEMTIYPVEITIRLSIHKKCKGNPVTLEMLKRAYRIESLGLEDPDRPHIVLAEIGPLPDFRSRLPS